MENRDKLRLNAGLYTACNVGNHDLAQTLIKYGADVDGDNSKPLVIAAKNGHTASAKLLLKCGAKVNDVDEHGDSALLVALQNRHYETVQLLLDNGARVTANVCTLLKSQFMDGKYLCCPTSVVTKLVDQMLALSNSPIHFEYLALYSFKHGLRDLSSRFLSVESSDTAKICNKFALYYSAKYDWFDIAKRLLANNNVNVDTIWHSKTAVFAACKHGSCRALEVLLEYNPNPYLHNNSNDLSRHLIFVACQRNYKQIVKMILDRGCFRSSSVHFTHSALHIAYDSGKWDIVTMMLSMGLGVDDPDSSGMTLLHKAVHSCNLDQVHELLEMRANVNWVNCRWESPLHLACVCEQSASDINRNTRSAFVELLVKSAASCNVMCKQGETPLYRACVNQLEVAVNILLEAGADCNLTSSHRYPIVAACHAGNLTVLNLLLQRPEIHLNVLGSVETDTSNVMLSTPLCVAVQKGDANAVKLLLIHNADVNFTDESGASPLDHVIGKIVDTADATQKSNFLEILQLLLSYKADVNHFVDSFSPLHRASHAGLETVVSLLLQSGANPFQTNSLGECALDYACQNNQIHLIQMFLKNLGKLWEVRDEFLYRIFAPKMPSLSVTTEYGSDDVTRILRDYGFECNASSPTVNSIQLPKDGSKVAEWLLKLTTIGANNVLVDKDDECPLYTACCSGIKSSATTTCWQKGSAHQNSPSTKTPPYATRLRKTLPLIRLSFEINMNANLPSSNQTEQSSFRKRKLSTTDEGLCNRKRQCRTPDNENYTHCAGKCEPVTAYRDSCKRSLSSLLCLMCKWGWTSVTAMLLERGADADFVAIDGDTPLQCAVEFVIQFASLHNCLGNSQIRLNASRLVSDEDYIQRIATDDVVTAEVDLQIASVGIVEKLIKHGASVNRQDAKGKTPLHRLVEAICRNVSFKPLWLVLDILLNNGADVNILSEDDESPLYTASAAGSTSVLAKLAKYSNAAGFKMAGKDPFLVPCWKGNLDIVNLLLQCGIDPNFKRNSYGKSDSSLEAIESDSPLCTAIRRGHIDIAHLLLKSGADLNEVDFDGCIPLLLGSDMLSEQLRDETFQTSMYHSINFGSYTADVNMFDEKGPTSLLLAGKNGMLDDNQNLPYHNADQNCTSAFACQLMDVEQTIMLIQGGASIDLARSDDNHWREEPTIGDALVDIF